MRFVKTNIGILFTINFSQNIRQRSTPPELIPTAQSSLMPGDKEIKHTIAMRPGMSAVGNIHQMRGVFVVQKRIGPHKFHIHDKLLGWQLQGCNGVQVRKQCDK
jgi:hypothetical protein